MPGRPIRKRPSLGPHRDRGWTLADSIDDDELCTLLDAAQERFSDLVTDRGVIFDVSALVVSGSTA
jgi:hypothetical protein